MSEQIKQRRTNAELFLDTWKQVAHYAVHDGVSGIFDMPDCPIDEVANKNQLRPNIAALLEKTNVSRNTLFFYTAAFSYFNANASSRVLKHFDMQDKAGHLVTGVGLDMDRKLILSKLMLGYEGW